MKLTDCIYMVGSGEFGISDPYDCHVYLIDGGEDAVLIDSGVGYDSDRIIENIKQTGCLEKLSRIYLTHLHADHCGGSADFQKLGVEVFAPQAEWLYLNEQPEENLEAYRIAQNSGCYPMDKEFLFPKPDHTVEENQIIEVGRFQLKAIQLRGHSPGLMAYYMDFGTKRVLFSSDYVFVNGLVGLLNCPGCDLSMYREDIKKLAGLDVDVLLPGHRMVAMERGQSHIDKAISNMSKAFMPPSF